TGSGAPEAVVLRGVDVVQGEESFAIGWGKAGGAVLVAEVGAGAGDRVVAPRVEAALTALGGVLPFFCRGEAATDPFAERVGLIPVEEVHRVGRPVGVVAVQAAR